MDSNQAQMMKEWAVLHGQARNDQVQSWHLTSKYVPSIPFRLPQGKVDLFQNHMPDAPIIVHEEKENEREEEKEQEQE